MKQEFNLFEDYTDENSIENKKKQEMVSLKDQPFVEMVEDFTQNQKPSLSSSLDIESKKHIKQVVEAYLFSLSEPILREKLLVDLKLFFPIKKRELNTILEELKKEYQDQKRAFHLEEIATGLILRSNSLFQEYLDVFHKNKKEDKLSKAAAEVLAIIAYKQPITRAHIEEIRGVDSSGAALSLIERGFVEVKGKLEAPGRPSLLGTTNQFLNHFGLKSLEELPLLESPPSKAD